MLFTSTQHVEPSFKGGLDVHYAALLLEGSAIEHSRKDFMMFNLTGEVGHQKDVDKICRNILVLEMSPQEIYLVRFKTWTVDHHEKYVLSIDDEVLWLFKLIH